MFNKKKKVEEASVSKDFFEVIIRYKNNKIFSYTQEHPLNSGESCYSCFYSFYKWFYYRDSPAFSFTHSEGLDILVRSEISSVSIKKSVK